MTGEEPHGSLDRGIGVAALVEGAGAVLIFIGAYAPWVQTFALFTTVAVRGVKIDPTYGRLLPLIPLVALGLLAWRWYVRRARWVHLSILAMGVLTVALSLAYGVKVKRDLVQAQLALTRAGQPPGAVRVGLDIGFYLTVAGGIALAVGGIVGSRQDRE